jgi:hypothetical protein
MALPATIDSGAVEDHCWRLSKPRELGPIRSRVPPIAAHCSPRVEVPAKLSSRATSTGSNYCQARGPSEGAHALQSALHVPRATPTAERCPTAPVRCASARGITGWDIFASPATAVAWASRIKSADRPWLQSELLGSMQLRWRSLWIKLWILCARPVDVTRISATCGGALSRSSSGTCAPGTRKPLGEC